MKKLANVRLPVIWALTLCAGIAVGVILYFFNASAAWLALSATPAVTVIAIAFILRRSIARTAILVFLPLFLFVGGALNSYYALSHYDYSEIQPDTVYTVRGTVIEKNGTANGEYIIIDKISVNGRDIGGRAYVYLSPTYGELCYVGYRVEFTQALQKNEPFPYGKLNYYAEDNVKYCASVYSGLSSTYGYSLFGSIRSSIRNVLFKNLDGETAAVSYAMLTGNTRDIENSTLESFRYGGIAHIFAVSGLHIGLIYAVLNFILKRICPNRYATAIICLTLIFFYSAVCGFTLSSVRAAVMCLVATAANLFFVRNDGLNCLSFAIIIILSVTPLSLFSAGFLLSVCAVGGIFVFSKAIEYNLRRIKIPKRICSAAGASVGAQLGTMPVMLATFGYISGAGLILNILIIPILSVVYIITFLTTLLGTIIPAAAPFILPYTSLPLQLIISVFVGAGFEKALIGGFGAGAFAILYFIAALVLSDKLNLKLITRLVAIGCSVAVLTGYVLLQINYPFSGYVVTVSADYKGSEVLIRSPYGKILVISNDTDPARLADVLNRYYSSNIDVVVILGEEGAVNYFDYGIDCDNVYVCYDDMQIQPFDSLEINYAAEFSVCGVNFTFYDKNTVVADAGGVQFGICSAANTTLFKCDVLISDTENSTVECGTEVFLSNRFGSLNVFDCGDITFTVTDGNFTVKTVKPPE